MALIDDSYGKLRVLYFDSPASPFGTVLAIEAVMPDGTSHAWRTATEPDAPADVVEFLQRRLVKEAHRECPDATEYRVYRPRTDDE